MIPNPYVLAAIALLVLGSLGVASCEHQRARAAVSDLAAYQASAEAEAAKLRAKAAEVTERVVIQYRDRVKEVRVVQPEVVHEIQVIRESGCVLPREFRLLHDRATGTGTEATTRADGATEVPCDVAAGTILENYSRARENAEQLKALQEWAASLSAP